MFTLNDWIKTGLRLSVLLLNSGILVAAESTTFNQTSVSPSVLNPQSTQYQNSSASSQNVSYSRQGDINTIYQFLDNGGVLSRDQLPYASNNQTYIESQNLAPYTPSYYSSVEGVNGYRYTHTHYFHGHPWHGGWWHHGWHGQHWHPHGYHWDHGHHNHPHDGHHDHHGHYHGHHHGNHRHENGHHGGHHSHHGGGHHK